MAELKKFPDERRQYERVSVQLSSNYEQNGSLYPCNIVDLSPQGLCMRTNSLLLIGDCINIHLESNILFSKVVRTDGNIVGVWFQNLTNQQINFIKWRCNTSTGQNSTFFQNQFINTGGKNYILSADNIKDEGLLGIVLAAIRKDCKGYIKDTALSGNKYQVEIYNAPESIASFETILQIWKAVHLSIN
jgi:hypothetical protein